MRITLNVSFLRRGHGSRGLARLELDDVTFTPSKEMVFEHPAFGERGRQATYIGYNIEEDSFYIDLGLVEMDTEEECSTVIDFYRSTGWALTGTR